MENLSFDDYTALRVSLLVRISRIRENMSMYPDTVEREEKITQLKRIYNVLGKLRDNA